MNTKDTGVVVIIPSLNPDENLTVTVRGILEQGFDQIILVDDGSRDECQCFFSELEKLEQVKVLHHKVNKGKGAALKTAFAYYLSTYDQKRYCGVVTADADGQHLAADIYKTAMRLKNSDMYPSNGRVLVLGTRDFNDPIVPFKSKNGNKITTFMFKLLYGKKINDTQTGLRGISNSYLKDCLLLTGERFEYEISMLIDAVVSNAAVLEEKIATVYLNQNRETHFNPVKDSIKIYKVMFNLRKEVKH